jgi:hypothetical protein
MESTPIFDDVFSKHSNPWISFIYRPVFQVLPRKSDTLDKRFASQTSLRGKTMRGHALILINRMARPLMFAGMLVMFLPFGVIVGLGKAIKLLSPVKDAL